MVSLRDAISGAPPTLIGDVPVDVILDYTPPREAVLTDRPVEEGFSFTDARIKKPQFLTLEGRFLDADYSFRNTARQAINGTFSTATWREKRDRLYEIFSSDELITITTPEETFINMMVLSVRPGIQNTESFRFTLEARQVFIVSTDAVAVDQDSIPKNVKANETSSQKSNNKRKRKKQNKGKAAAKASTERRKTMAAGIVDSFSALLGG